MATHRMKSSSPIIAFAWLKRPTIVSKSQESRRLLIHPHVLHAEKGSRRTTESEARRPDMEFLATFVSARLGRQILLRQNSKAQSQVSTTTTTTTEELLQEINNNIVVEVAENENTNHQEENKEKEEEDDDMWTVAVNNIPSSSSEKPSTLHKKEGDRVVALKDEFDEPQNQEAYPVSKQQNMELPQSTSDAVSSSDTVLPTVTTKAFGKPLEETHKTLLKSKSMHEKEGDRNLALEDDIVESEDIATGSSSCVADVRPTYDFPKTTSQGFGRPLEVVKEKIPALRKNPQR